LSLRGAPWAAAALFAAAVGASVLQRRAFKLSAQGGGASPGGEAPNAATALCREVIPVWGRQIESSRLQTEEAIGALSQQFGQMYNRLVSAVALFDDTHDGDGRNMAGMLAASRDELKCLIASLRDTVAAKFAMLQSIEQLTAFTTEL